ncbi:MAG: AzlD domain-containing protein [Rhodovarius sp.]|nr:AzlD domain-containing protein [Rhodovarius sp.]
MSEPFLALLWLILACQAMRAAGLLLAGPLRPDHPVIRWAASVAVATLAAFILLAIAAPSGTMAEIPAPARWTGAGVAIAVLLWGRERVLPALLAGLAAAGLVWLLLAR